MSVRRYRKKPVVIEADRVTSERIDEVAAWCGGKPAEGPGRDGQTVVGISIPTLEGAHFAAIGCWVIRGVQGEFYGCQPAIFDATYEAESA